MRLLLTLAGSFEIYKYAAVLDLDRISGNAILFETRFAKSAATMKFPVMPGADDVIAVQPTITERSADMVARV